MPPHHRPGRPPPRRRVHGTAHPPGVAAAVGRQPAHGQGQALAECAPQRRQRQRPQRLRHQRQLHLRGGAGRELSDYSWCRCVATRLKSTRQPAQGRLRAPPHGAVHHPRGSPGRASACGGSVARAPPRGAAHPASRGLLVCGGCSATAGVEMGRSPTKKRAEDNLKDICRPGSCDTALHHAPGRLQDLR